MTEGIRATVGFDSPSVCPIASFSAETGERVRKVVRSVVNSREQTSTTEFAIASDEGEAFNPIFDHGNLTRYRFNHEDELCPCACLGRLGCPAARYAVDDGELTIVFYATDYEELQTAIAELRERFPSLDIKRLIQSPSSVYADDVVMVDRGQLTDRQLEVLESAYEMGYFERPREANATQVAAHLGIDVSTFGEHLVAAQRKLLADLLE